jgi:hypothetical protein
MFLGLPDHNPLVRVTDPDPSILSSSKNRKKALIPGVLRLLQGFLSLKNDVNVTSKSNKQRNLKQKFICC